MGYQTKQTKTELEARILAFIVTNIEVIEDIGDGDFSQLGLDGSALMHDSDEQTFGDIMKLYAESRKEP